MGLTVVSNTRLQRGREDKSAVLRHNCVILVQLQPLSRLSVDKALYDNYLCLMASNKSKK